MAKKDKLEERNLKILDASIKEDEGTEESPRVVKSLWLLLQDVETENVFSSILTLDDIRSITGMDRDLQGRELYNLATALRSREAPVKLIINPNNNEIKPETINEKAEE
jgi:hypothetical protein